MKNNTSPSGEIDSLGFAKAIINSTSDSIIAMDVTGKIIFWNHCAVQFYKYTKEEILGKHVTLIFKEENQASVNDRIKRVMAGENVPIKEIEVVDKFKKHHWVLLSLNSIKDENGEITHIVGRTKGINKKTQAEQKLQEVEALLGTAINAMGEGFVVQDLKDKILSANQAAADILGLSMNQLLGKDSFDPGWKALHDDGSPFKPEEHPSVIVGITGKPVRNVIMNVSSGKNHRNWILINSMPVFTEKKVHTLTVTTFLNITEERVLNKLLKKSEQKFKNLTENAKVAIAIYSPNLGKNDCLYVNNYWENITGYTKKEAENMDALTIVAPEFKETVKERAQMRLSGNEVSDNYEIRIITKKGVSKWVEFSATIIEFKGKDAIQITAIDITERRDVGLKLQRSTQLLEASQRIAKVGGWELDIATGKIFWTAETYHILETSPSEFNPTVDDVVNFYLPESRKIISKALELAFNKGQGFDLELEMYTAKENQIHVRTECEVHLKNGKPDKLIGTFQDITNQKQKEAELILAKKNIETSQNFLDNIINNIGDPVFVKDETSSLVLVNDAFCQIFGLDKNKIIGKTLVEDVSPEEGKSFLKVDKEVLKTGKESIVEESLTVRGGERKILSTRKTRFIDANKKKYIIGVIRDLTNRINIENELKKAQSIARIGNWYLDISTNEITWSDELYKMYSLDPELPIPSFEEHVKYFTPESWQVLNTSLENTIKTGEPYSIELQVNEVFGNLQWKWVSAQGEAVFDSENRVIAVRGTAQDITEYKETMKALKDSEQRFFHAFENSPVPVSILNLKTGERIAVNQKGCEFFGYSKEELLSVKNINKVNLAVDDKDFKLAVNKLLKQGELREYPLLVQTKAGEFKHVLVNSTRAYKDFNDIYIVAYFDVTIQKEAQDRLIELKTKFEVLSNVTFEGILIHDKGVPVDMNTSCHDMFGYTRDEVLDKDLIELVVRKDYHKEIIKNIQNDYELPYEVIAIKKDGTEIPVELEGKSCYTEDNKKLRVTAVRDITERKIAEAKIKESEAKINTILNSLPSSVCVIDTVGNIIHVNDAWKQFGVSNSIKHQDYTKYNYFDVCRSDFENEGTSLVLDGLTDLVNGKIENFEYEYPCHTPNRKYWFLMSADLMKTSEKQIVISHRDVTSLKLAEQELKESLSKNKLAINIANLGVWTFDINMNKLIWSDALFEIFDTTSEEFDGAPESFKKYVHPEDLEYVTTELNKVFNKKPMSNIYFRIQRSSGEIRHIEASATPILEANELVKIVGVNRDISEDVKAKNELSNAFNEISDLKLQLEAENIYLKEELKLEGNFEDIIGSSKSLKKVLKQVEKVAKSGTTVLVLGETGTGKELIAKAIHAASDRKNKSLVKVNCSALPTELIESELFGHEKGAFTGAINKKIGRFELANQGTIFLDEIGDLPIDLQTRLLRVLQESEFERLGGEKTIQVDVRVITATNRNLEELVIEGKFRQDLYYRLNVFPVTSPPLRDRKEDIPSLVNHFIHKYGNKVKNTIKSIHKSSLDRLIDYDWPGNIRELEHVIERAIILNHGAQLRLGNWFVGDNTEIVLDGEYMSLEQKERDYITKVLDKTNGKIRGKNGAAEILGLKPTTLESRMKKLNISKNQ